MSLTLSPPTVTLAALDETGFAADGGQQPYTFSIASGLGTIDPFTGDYTAPNSSGSAVVQVTDANGLTAQSSVIINTVLTRVCDIIREEMQLDDDQCYLWNQKLRLPTDKRLYVAVGVSSVKFIGSTRTAAPIDDDDLGEELSVNVCANLSIDILSDGPDARDRKEEILLAFISTYAQQVQEANGFYIATLPTGFVNLSEVEGSAIPYRFRINVNVQYSVVKKKTIDSYNSISETVITGV